MKKLFTRIFITAIILTACSIAARAQEMDLMVIGHPKGVPPDLNLNLLRSVLKGEKQRWGDGTKVVIALMKTSTPIGAITCRKIYNMSGNEVNKYWLALVFQGKADAPTFFNSVNDLESFVSQTPGAIGIIPQGGGSGNRVINVDAKRSI